jgi:hypothetical protein
VVAERLPAICGSATEAMAVSSTSINVGSITDAAIRYGLQSGHHDPSGLAFESSATATLDYKFFSFASTLTELHRVDSHQNLGWNPFDADPRGMYARKAERRPLTLIPKCRSKCPRKAGAVETDRNLGDP